MAESILKLRVDSQEYESKIKRASAGLQALGKSLNDAGKTFADVDKDQVTFIRELGKMDTVSRDARGKINELSKAFVDLSSQYKQMDDAAKNSAGGKALAESLEQIRQRTIAAKNEFKELNDQLQDVKMPEIKTGGGGLFGEGGLTGMLAVTGGNLLASGITKLGSEIADTVQQSIELAKSGEGVRLAFDRLNQPGLLANLKEATHGTVSELELMKAAVKFDDFKLPVEQLGTLLAFAQKKAKDTGQSVDYMVDSIVTGLGRKSLMILDNLGLSAAQVKERMAETGDMTKAVADIIREEMAKAGDYVETAADRAARAAADAQNQMEELGRKAMPVAEQWASTWATIKMGALDLLNNAVTPLINALTEAGRLRAAQQDRGSGGRIAQQISWLQNPGSEGKQSVYDRIIGSYVDEINHARTEYNKLQKDAVWNPFAAWNADKALAKLNVIKQEYADFKAQAAAIMNPKNEVVVKTDNAQHDVDSLKKKLLELQSEYRKAIKSGDTAKSSDILKQINQTKKDIRGLDPNALKTTGTTKTPKTEEQLNNEEIQKLTQEYINASDEQRAAIRAEIKDLQDKNKVIKQLTEEAQGMKFDSGSLPALTRQLQDLQKEQSQAANGEEWDEYQRKINATNDKINVLKGNLPKDQQATFTMNVNAEQLEQLRMLLPTDDKTVRINVEEGDVNLPQVPTDDKTIKVNITADTAEAMKQVRDMVGDIEGMDVVIEPKVEVKEPDLRTPFQKLQDSIKLEISAKNVDVDKNTLKSLTEVVTKYDIQTGTIDMQQVMAQTEELTKGGMTAGEAYSKALQTAIAQNLDLSTIQQRIGDEIDIPDETWQALQDQINEKLADLDIEPIKIDFSTGNIKKQSKEMSKDWKDAASAIQSVGSAMASIEDPAAKVVGTVAQAIATMALSYAQASSAAAANPANAGWGWIAFAATGLATMLSSIAAIHSATGYAQGGMIKGNSYSGDNIGGLVDGSQLVGLNAGEVVLNASQQSMLANNLQGGGGGKMEIVGVLTGENVVLMADRWGRRTGRGELLFGKNL